MGAETMEWYNTRNLIGRTDEHGNAWHFSAEHQGDEPNHYPGFIPREDLTRRIFNWQAISEPMYRLDMTTDGVGYVEVEGRKLLLRSDTRETLNVTSDRYGVHQYDEVLVNNIADLLDVSDGQLGIASAGELEQGGTAWVQVEMTEGVTVGDDLLFPFLTGASSHSGRYATQYRAGARRVVCDNTLAALMNYDGGNTATDIVKVKHTKHSALRIEDARRVLGIAFATRDAFTAEVEQLLATTVSGHDFLTIVDAIYPKPEAKSDDKDVNAKAQLNFQNRRDGHLTMFLDRNDDRIAPWSGTGWGAVQTINTWAQHNSPIRDEARRAERNRLRFLDGAVGTLDRKAVAATLALCG